MVRFLLFGAALAAVMTLSIGDAAAAPQILGIVASNGPVPLSCDDQGCRADLSTFCLQQPRANPDEGQVYRLSEGAPITLIGKNAAGHSVYLPAAPYISFTTARGFTAVQVSLSAAVMAELGLQSVSVEVGRKATLIPFETADDANPQSAEEIALATGTLREQGQKFFDDTGQSGDAIRLSNLMANELPPQGRRPSDTDGHILNAALAAPAGQSAGPAGIELAKSMYLTCVNKTDVTHHIDNMRNCLEGTHDRLVVNTNIDFWNSLNGY
ncbi:MAG: hypothetical protein ACREEE_08550 [Dongiaceae bacterium]